MIDMLQEEEEIVERATACKLLFVCHDDMGSREIGACV